MDTIDTSFDTTWNTTCEEEDENYDRNNQTKRFNLRTLRIESKGGITSKFVLDTVITPKKLKKPVVFHGSGASNGAVVAVAQDICARPNVSIISFS